MSALDLTETKVGWAPPPGSWLKWFLFWATLTALLYLIVNS